MNLNLSQASEKIKIYDDVIPYEQVLTYYKRILKLPFYYGEVDDSTDETLEPVGLVHDFDATSTLYHEFFECLCKCDPRFKNATLKRAYINLFMKREWPYFHMDGNVDTCLFYINPIMTPNDGGETQFLLNDNTVFGVLPSPGRLVVFDGRIKHKATSFLNIPRLTLVLKYQKCE